MLVVLQRQLRLRAGLGTGESGFTYIEVLVTMLILSILAAIALAAFGDQVGKSKDARVKVTAHSAEVAMESCMVETAGQYKGCNLKALRELDPSLPGSPALNVSVPASGTSYTLTIRSEPTSQIFYVTRSAKGIVSFPCKKAGVGGCPASGSWG